MMAAEHKKQYSQNRHSVLLNVKALQRLKSSLISPLGPKAESIKRESNKELRTR